MSFKSEMYIGPSGAGKSAALSKDILTEAHKNPDKNYILIVPDQSASVFEKKLLSMNDKMFGIPGLLNVDIVGMSRMAHNIFAEFDVPDTEVLEEFERNMMVRAAASRVVGKLQVYGKSIDKKGFISQAKTLISEFIQYGITGEDIELLEEELKLSGQDSLCGKLHDIGLIYEDIRENYFAGGKHPGEEKMKVMARCLLSQGESRSVDGAVLIFDEFRGFTPDQFSVIEALKTRASKMIFSITIDTDIVKKGIEVKEHELYYQSYLTIEALKEILGETPVIKYYERGTDISRFAKGSGLEHLEKGLFRFPVKEFTEKPNDIEIYRMADPVSELSVVAEDILRRVRRGARFRDFAIVTGDISALSNYSSAVFEDYGIPVFMDETGSIGKNPYTEGLIKLTQIIDKDFSYETMFGFIKLGLIDEELSGCTDVLENHCIKHGIRGRRCWERSFRIPEDRIKSEIDDEIREDIRRAEDSRESMMKLLTPMTDLNKKSSTVFEMCGALRKMMDKDHLNYERRIAETAKLYESMERYSEARAMEQLYDKLSDILGSMEELLGHETVDMHTFSEMLATGTEDLKLGVIPPTLDAVTVADSGRSRLGTVKTLYFINMNDGIIPSPRKDGKILTDKDKDCIERILSEKGIRKCLAPNDRLESYMEQFFIYQMMTRPAERLVMTFADATRDGAPSEMSYIVGRVMRMFPKIVIERKAPVMFRGTLKTDIFGFTDNLRRTVDHLKDKNDTWYTEETGAVSDGAIHDIALFSELSKYSFKDYKDALFFSNEAETIPQDIMENLRLEISVSKLETYAECPYEYFMKYILRLAEREERNFNYGDAGNIVHKTLELALSRIKEEYGNRWTELSDEEIRSISDKALEDAVKSCEKVVEEDETEHGRNTVIIDKLSDLMHRTIDTIRYQLSMGSLLPENFEQRFTATFKAKRPSGKDAVISINGVVDRIDGFDNEDAHFFRIVDYKTSDQSFRPEHIAQGTDLQLTVYMDIIREIMKRDFKDEKVIPAGLYYYHVSNPDINRHRITKGALNDSEGDVAKAAVIKQRKELRLRGAINDDDSETHEYLKLQDRNMIDEKGSLGGSTVVQASVAGRYPDKSYTARTSAVGTEQLEDLGRFGRSRMVEITEDILAGKIDKHPIRYSSARYRKCSICDYKTVCRFGVYSGNVNYVPKQNETDIEMIKAMKDKISKEVEYDKVERLTTDGSGQPGGKQ